MGEITQRRQEADQGLPEIEIKDLSGLSLKLDKPNQPNNVFKQLQNLDLFIPGSIRKVRSPLPYGFPLQGQSYLNFINYWAQPNKATGPVNRVLAITSNAQVVDMITGQVYVDFSPFVTTPLMLIPYMEVFPLYFNPFDVKTWSPGLAVTTTDCVMKYGSYDGVFYIYSPQADGTTGAVEPGWRGLGDPVPITDGSVVWLNQGEVKSERFQENALVWQIPGFPQFFMVEYQYDPNNAGEAPSYWFRYVGIFQPKVPIEVKVVTVSPNLDGYSPVAGRGFVYTLYDPHTFHESSPAPFAGPTLINDIEFGTNNKETIPGSLLRPLPTGTGTNPFLSYQSYYLAVSGTDAQDAVWAGYESMFVYATKDGGATFYRIPTLLDDQGNIISNSDGSVQLQPLLDQMYAQDINDLFPLPTSMFHQWSIRVYEGSGQINLAPDPANLGPQSWTQANAQQIIVVPGDGQPPPQGLGNINAIYAAGELTGQGGTALHKSTLRSNKIPVAPGQTYWFSAYMDTTQLTGGTARWDIIAGDFSNQNSPYLTLTWGPGENGFKSGTFVSDHANVRIRMFAQGVTTQDTGDVILWSTPFLYPGTAAPTTPTNYPTPDDSLIVPAPAVLSQQPPPVFTQMAMFSGAIFGVEEGTFNVWFSNIGDFQSYGAEAFLPLSDSAGVPVLELKNVFSSLLIGKQSSMASVRPNTGGTPPFAQIPIDPNHGVQSVRSSIGFGAGYITLLPTGLTMVTLGSQLLETTAAVSSVTTGFMPERLIGDPVKPYTDLIEVGSLRTQRVGSPCPGIDTNRNFFFFSFLYSPFNWEKLLIANMSHQGPSPWSELVPAVPVGVSQSGANSFPVSAMREIIDPQTGNLVYVVTGYGVGQAYSLFAGTQDGSLVAAAETWPLPDLSQLPNPMRDAIKIFHELWVEGKDIENWTYQWSTDLGVTYSSPMQLRVRNKIGVNGRQISFIFTHAVAAADQTVDSTEDPMLSYMKITYSARRQASGQNGY